jgi:hypothetical protein
MHRFSRRHFMRPGQSQPVRKHRAPRLCCRRSRGCEEVRSRIRWRSHCSFERMRPAGSQETGPQEFASRSAAVDRPEHVTYPYQSIHFSFGKQGERLICPGRVEQPCMFQASGQVEIESASLRRRDRRDPDGVAGISRNSPRAPVSARSGQPLVHSAAVVVGRDG